MYLWHATEQEEFTRIITPSIKLHKQEDVGKKGEEKGGDCSLSLLIQFWYTQDTVWEHCPYIKCVHNTLCAW
jgi:hypothetical protein